MLGYHGTGHPWPPLRSRPGDDLVLSTATVPEKYPDILEVPHDLVRETKNLQSITVHDKCIKLKYITCADLKLTNVIQGLGSSSADFSSAWCKTKSSKYYDVKADIHGINQLCQKRKPKTHENYNCVHPPIFPYSAVSLVIPYPLHLYIWISDQLIRQLVLYFRTVGNIGKNKMNVDISKCKLVLDF